MAYRPYPNADRALRQVDRHRQPAPPSEFQLSLAEQANAALEAAGRALEPFMRGIRRNAAMVSPPVDEYRLSTRPGVVSGGQ
jgi:hypothetical protein